jgi:hypothetical protein
MVHTEFLQEKSVRCLSTLQVEEASQAVKAREAAAEQRAAELASAQADLGARTRRLEVRLVRSSRPDPRQHLDAGHPLHCTAQVSRADVKPPATNRHSSCRLAAQALAWCKLLPGLAG